MSTTSSFSQSELETLSFELPGISGSPEDRFIQSCIEYYRGWLDIQSNMVNCESLKPNSALVLLYSESPKVDPGFASSNSDPKKLFRSSTSLGDGLSVCNENLQIIYEYVPSFSDINDALRFVSKYFSENSTFVVILLAQRRMFIHCKGERIDEWCEAPYTKTFDNSTQEINPEIIQKYVEEFHDECTKTHRATIARLMWDTKSVCFKKHQLPELHIQSGLLIHFKALLRTGSIVVDEEIGNPGGRMDIRIVRLSATGSNPVTTILELKVLAPTNSENANLKWAIKGVVQSNGYRNQHTDACFACIFDARKNKALVLSGLTEKANELDVILSKHEMELPPIAADSKE